MTSRVTLESVRFAVLERPICVWDPHLAALNQRFLAGLDPDFFLHHCPSAGPPENDQRTALRDAITLRIAFGMGLESLFALLGATIQAPDCIFGWLSQYRNDELVELVRRINTAQPVLALSPFKPATWENVARVLLLPVATKSAERHAQIAARFASAWQIFAATFIDPQRSMEYNSLKHSFRVNPAGFNVEITHEDVTLLKSSEHLGHTFPFVKKNEGRRSDFSVSTATFALTPSVYSAALKVISCSLSNAVAFCRMRSGDDPAQLTVRMPDDATFDALTPTAIPVASLTYGARSTPDRYWTDQEVLSVYDDPAK
jgi:hypothetical protein